MYQRNIYADTASLDHIYNIDIPITVDMSFSYYKVENNLNFTKLYYNSVVRLRINYS